MTRAERRHRAAKIKKRNRKIRKIRGHWCNCFWCRKRRKGQMLKKKYKAESHEDYI